MCVIHILLEVGVGGKYPNNIYISTLNFTTNVRTIYQTLLNLEQKYVRTVLALTSRAMAAILIDSCIVSWSYVC